MSADVCNGKVEQCTPAVSVYHDVPSDDLLKNLIDEFNMNNQGLLMEMVCGFVYKVMYIYLVNSMCSVHDHNLLVVYRHSPLIRSKS